MSFFNLVNLNINIITSNKLFVEQDIYTFYLPYYMIIVADRVKNRSIGISMYEKIFKSKPEIFGEWWIKNLLFNLRFFIDHVPENKKYDFFNLANDYIKFLYNNNLQLIKFDFLKDYRKYLSINFIFPEKDVTQKCINSKNILIYTGFSNKNWNYSYTKKNALGGSEKAVAYVSKYFSKDYHIYISGGVEKEEFDNITYVPLNDLKNLVNNTYFHTVIVSRYVAFYDMFPETMFYQSYIWAHDMELLRFGSDLNVEQILDKYSNKINGCICLTEFHKKVFEDKYPVLKNKIKLINNGINCENFITANKIKNKFIYSSCVERGLKILIQLWPELIQQIPDAKLVIATYNPFPRQDNQFELKLFEEIQKLPSIKYLGNLSTQELYQEMSTSEFWLYTCTFPETSCITALEMLMSGVIPIYYPYAGLPYTINGNGIQTSQGNEISDVLKLTDEEKTIMIKKGKDYAETCSWKSRAQEWENILFQKVNYSIQIVNLKKREDRKNEMINKLSKENVNNYAFFEGVYGKELEPSEYIKNLFRNNDFNYRKGVIGCALSHIKLYEQLLNDDKNDLYVILEDDIEFVDNFVEKLDYCVNICKKLNYDYTYIGGNIIKNKNNNINNLNIIDIKPNDLNINCNGTFGYIISKNGAQQLLNYINLNGLQWAIDKPIIYFNSLKNIYTVNEYLVKAYSFQIDKNIDTNIQLDQDKFIF